MAGGADDGTRDRQPLSAAKRRLLKARLTRALNRPESGRQIPSALDSDEFPATPTQSRFWFLDELSPESAAYNMHIALDLIGELRAVALENALQALLQEHDILRSSFMLRNGRLWQKIGSAGNVTLTRHPRTSFRDPGSFLARLTGQPFSLRSGPLMRAHLVELDTRHHVLLLVLHHIVCDEPSIEIILRHLAQRYGVLSEQAEQPGKPRVRFADYAVWQQQQLSAVLDAKLPFWTAALHDLDERTGVPANKSRAGAPSRRGRIAHRMLPADLSAAANALAKNEQTTLFTVMTAVWLALLNRYTGNTDIAVGTPASLRTLPELQDTVGLFLNTLVLRFKIDTNQSFHHLLRLARNVTLDAFSNQEVPLGSIVETLNPPRAAGENPFFDTMIVQESQPAPLRGFGDLRAERRTLDTEACKFDLTLFFRDSGDGMLLSVEYDTSLYDRRRIDAVLDHYAALLGTFIADSEQSVGHARFLRKDELEWLHRTSAGPWQDVGTSPAVADQIDRNLGSLDQRIAVADQKGSCSYHELNRLVANIADRIRLTEPRPRSVVVLLDRDRWAIAAMLAAWRIGACYVPLDPSYPAKRLSSVLQAIASSDLSQSVVLTSTAFARLLPDETRIVCVDTPLEIQDLPQDIVQSIEPDDEAYVIFTSGSSGQPKGVRITHENLRVSNLARERVYGNAPQSFLLLSPLPFDSSVAGLYWTLANGGTLIVASTTEARDSHDIVRLIEDHNVTHTLMLPALYELVLRSSSGCNLSSLRAVIVAGEPCPDSLPAAHARALPGTSLLNEYGPTEGTVWATVHEVSKNDGPVPIGTAIASMRTYVLDDNLQLRPAGIAGELCLSGPTVSPGYLDPRQNGQKFVDTELFGGNRRVYRTGDRVRFDDQGRLLYLGRIDEQVKIRGHRVELEEINAALRRHRTVTDAAAVFDPSRQVLQAYVAAPQSAVDAETLDSLLRSRLPDYMNPSRISVVDELPRLPNGKLDLRALNGAAAIPTADEPDSEDYRALKNLWCACLKLDDCSADRSFFDLGGHSLLAVKLLLDVEDRFGHRLSLASLYSSPTLLELFARLQRRHSDGDREILYPAKPDGSEPPLFIAQAPLAHLVDEIDPALPLLGLYHGINPPPGPEVTVEMMAARYLRAVRRRQPSGPYRLAGFSFGSMVAFEMAQQLFDAGERVDPLILLDPPPPVPEGDIRFRTNRVLARIRSAGSGANRAAFALSEARRIGARVAQSVRQRLNRRIRGVVGRTPTREALLHAGISWSKTASQAYRYRAYDAPVLLVIPRRPEASIEEQVDRWNGVLTGHLEVLPVDGPEHHLNLLEPPWVAGIGNAINERLVNRGDAESGAA